MLVPFNRCVSFCPVLCHRTGTRPTNGATTGCTEFPTGRRFTMIVVAVEEEEEEEEEEEVNMIMTLAGQR